MGLGKKITNAEGENYVCPLPSTSQDIFELNLKSLLVDMVSLIFSTPSLLNYEHILSPG